YNTTKRNDILDGCIWFGCDNGVFGSEFGKSVIQKYVEMLEFLKDKNTIFEKFHISDQVYNFLYYDKNINYRGVERRLRSFDCKIVFCKIKEDEDVFKKRIEERLKSVPHYQRIVKPFSWYIKQQRTYEQFLEKSILPVLEVDMTKIPNEKYKEVLGWIKEEA
ncbi:hypothetical protein COY23_00855, partial [bacterium (Candidatus Torokbacteria) CG_4_10_14_0_2_um_filter_35_8]